LFGGATWCVVLVALIKELSDCLIGGDVGVGGEVGCSGSKARDPRLLRLPRRAAGGGAAGGRPVRAASRAPGAWGYNAARARCSETASQ
jgi:hypothetical protein